MGALFLGIGTRGVHLKDKRVILVHGGAWAVPEGEIEPHREGVRKAALAGWDVLTRGGSPLDAVAEAVRSTGRATPCG